MLKVFPLSFGSAIAFRAVDGAVVYAHAHHTASMERQSLRNGYVWGRCRFAASLRPIHVARIHIVKDPGSRSSGSPLCPEEMHP